MDAKEYVNPGSKIITGYIQESDIYQIQDIFMSFRLLTNQPMLTT